MWLSQARRLVWLTLPCPYRVGGCVTTGTATPKGPEADSASLKKMLWSSSLGCWVFHPSSIPGTWQGVRLTLTVRASGNVSRSSDWVPCCLRTLLSLLSWKALVQSAWGQRDVIFRRAYWKQGCFSQVLTRHPSSRGPLLGKEAEEEETGVRGGGMTGSSALRTGSWSSWNYSNPGGNLGLSKAQDSRGMTGGFTVSYKVNTLNPVMITRDAEIPAIKCNYFYTIHGMSQAFPMCPTALAVSPSHVKTQASAACHCISSSVPFLSQPVANQSFQEFKPNTFQAPWTSTILQAMCERNTSGLTFKIH